jgi:hypothetical protein
MAKIYQSFPNLLSPLQSRSASGLHLIALGAYTLYQLGLFLRKKRGGKKTLTGESNFFFTLSSLLGCGGF